MADKKLAEIVLERTYNIPLRREFLKVQNWRRTEKAVTATREFLKRHMKAESVDQVKLGKELNEELWKHGIKNPPHHVKVTVTKDKDGLVKAELFGRKMKKTEETKEAKEKVKEKKQEAPTPKAKEAEIKEEPKTETVEKKEIQEETKKKSGKARSSTNK